jgi:hypothetical protein
LAQDRRGDIDSGGEEERVKWCFVPVWIEVAEGIGAAATSAESCGGCSYSGKKKVKAHFHLFTFWEWEA